MGWMTGHQWKPQYIPQEYISGSQFLSPEGFICDLMDIQTKEFFGSMFEHVFQETFRTSSLVPPKRYVSSLSKPVVTMKTAKTAPQ